MNTTATSRPRPALIILLILLLAVPFGVFGQQAGSAPAFKQEELNQMLMPIALYPDSLPPGRQGT
jgi:hypothetical protein